MTIDGMRKHVSEVYDNWRWRDRVKGMQDNQVMAIYFSMLEKGKLKKEKKGRNHQMTLMELYPNEFNEKR